MVCIYWIFLLKAIERYIICFYFYSPLTSHNNFHVFADKIVNLDVK